MKIKRILTGATLERYRLYSVCSERGDSELEKFLADYADQSIAVLRCMSDAAENGPFSLPKSRVHLIDKDNKIYEFIGGRLRVAFFTDNNNVVICSHGILKTTKETLSRDKKKATRAKKAYSESKENRTLESQEEENGEWRQI